VSTTPSALTPLSFTGVSNYANDFQSVISRAVSIAQLPITALTNHQSDITSEGQLASGLQSAVASLATMVTNLGNLGTNGGLTGSSSNTAFAQVNNITMTSPASFQISNVSSLASIAAYSTTNGYASATTTPVSSSGTMQLVINGTAVTPNINLTGTGQNNLTGLASAINALNAGVTATVISTGTGATPNYLSISDNSTGQNTIQLVENPAGTPSQIALSGNSGSNASFEVNGQPVISSTNTISTVIPGMTFTLTGTTTGTQSATLAVASDPTQISGQLQNFVSQYNNVTQLLSAQIGPNAGLLLGNSMINGINMALQGLVNYRGTGTGGIENLADLGIEISETGVMSLNQNTFNELTTSQIATAFTFLGSSTTGFGAQSGLLTDYSDPITGSIAGQRSEWTTDTTNITNHINTLVDQANQMQQTLSAELQSADEQIANLQSQQQALSASIQSLNFTAFGYNNTNTSNFTPSS
jgi:flagellar hook-associated protein 2